MVARPRHAQGYHEWARDTPVADAIVIAVASVVIGGYALLFLVLALMRGDAQLALANALLLVCMRLSTAWSTPCAGGAATTIDDGR